MTTPPEKGGKPRLLSVNFFPAFCPPASGGEQRLLHLYAALSEYYEIDLVTSTDFGARREEVRHTASLRELRLPKDEHWTRAYETLAQADVSGDLSAFAFALAVAEPDCALRRLALRLAGKAQVVIHEFPYSEPIFHDARPQFEVYNSHNFELGLISSTLSGDGVSRCFQKLVHLERNLAARARLVFATSPIDGEKFRLLYDVSGERLRLCPNGYAEAETMPIAAARRQRGAELNPRPQLLFIGSRHRPNVDAAVFLFALAADLRDCDIIIAGAVSEEFAADDLPTNVRLAGQIDELEKRSLFAAADLFLNPVTRGSGTSLKSVEALASWLPMVATPEAVRGLGVESGRHALVCARRQFAAAVRSLLASGERRLRIAEEGLDFARQRFTWPAIAQRLARDLRAENDSSIRARRGKAKRPRPLVVALNDYPIAAATSGGSVRIKEVLTALAADVVLLTFGAAYEVLLPAPGLLQVTFEKSPHHRALEEQLNAGNAVSVDDVVAGLFLGCDHVFAELCALLATRATAVVFEHCYMAPALDWLRPLRPDLPVVYAAHNIEPRIKAELLPDHPARDPLLRFVAELERRLTAAVDLVVACTKADAAYFRAAGASTIVVGNGGALPMPRPQPATNNSGVPLRVGFLGSAHPPNIEAAQYIVDNLAPLFADTVFEFVGSVCEDIIGPLPANVAVRGVVDDDSKAEIMSGWSIALNPVDTGGGSSLKLPDYLAHGLPTISTPQGARGFPLGEAGIGSVVERCAFAPMLRNLLNDAERRARYRHAARDYAATQLTWEGQAAPLRDWLLKRDRAPDYGRRQSEQSLLVVTYRYTEPPLGGAEEYLIEVLRWLRPRFRTIDLAAVDVVGPLTNRHHYGCGFTAGAGTPRILGELFDGVRLFPAEAISEDAMLAACRRLERSRMRSELDLYAPFVEALRRPDAMIPLSGFYWPEHHDGRLCRWTAPEFAFVVPPGTQVFAVDGWTPRRKQLVVSASRIAGGKPGDAVELCRQYVDGDFSCTVGLTFDAVPDVIRCAIDEHDDPGDCRPFGVVVRGATVLVRTGEASAEHGNLPAYGAALNPVRAALGMEIEPLLRTHHGPAWRRQLAALAESRPAADEASFAAVRGPHAPALQAWLAENGAHYDVVLVQGIPFDTVPSSVATLAGLTPRPRIVVLPHFHGEDPFYYWRGYLDSFAMADKTLFFSDWLAEGLAHPAKNVVVSGGGVRLEERGRPECIARFRDLHPSATPFFLVLGRKVASKGYHRVIEAIAALNAAGRALDLVMIGPDEDGTRIREAGVHYLGQQPRAVVLGALCASIGLVTMSDSESFGIVVCEAWQFRKPVIANGGCAAFRELVADRETGILVGSQTELVAAMAEIAEDPALRARLGEAGFQRAVAEFGWQRVAEQVAEVLLAG